MESSYPRAFFRLSMTQRQARWAGKLYRLCLEVQNPHIIPGSDDCTEELKIAQKITTEHGFPHCNITLLHHPRYQTSEVLVRCDTNVCVNWLVAWMQQVMQKFELRGPWYFNWSYSRHPTPGGSGGGLCIVLPTDSIITSTDDIIGRYLSENARSAGDGGVRKLQRLVTIEFDHDGKIDEQAVTQNVLEALEVAREDHCITPEDSDHADVTGVFIREVVSGTVIFPRTDQPSTPAPSAPPS